MKILVIGKNGQLGDELSRSLQVINDRATHVVALDRSQMDLTSPVQVGEVICRLRPNIIVNAAAYTAVDLAEQDPEMAMRVNAEAAGEIARQAHRCGALLVHYSTDHVFDGTKNSPYLETDATNPINAYGRSKLAGEQAIQGSGAAHLILRTSWLYSNHGNNFLKTIQRLAAQHSELTIVADQFGAPTWSRTVAQQTAHLLSQLCGPSPEDAVSGISAAMIDSWLEYSGVYHLTAQGHTSWHGFATAIVRNGCHAQKVTVLPIATEDYPVAARRPRNARLCCKRYLNSFGTLPDWNVALDACLRG